MLPEGRQRRARAVIASLGLGVGLGFGLGAGLEAQLAERPDDPTGLSIREPRVRVLHSRDGTIPGTSGHLIQHDPWLAYQRGRSLFFREWSRDDGVFEHLVQRPAAAATTSCGMCHNLPFPSPGAGGTSAAALGVGRTAPHLFGAGLLETLGLQIGAQALLRHDLDGDGHLDVPVETRGRRLLVEAAPGTTVDFGSLDDQDGDGWPDLDPAFLIRFVDASGQLLPLDPDLRLGHPRVAGYQLRVGTFASSAGDHQFGSLRTFSAGVLASIMGVLPAGPVTATDAGFVSDQWGRTSLSGALLDRLVLPADPGVDPATPAPGTLSVGELDLLEHYLLNHPPPALGRQDATTHRGRRLLGSMGCHSCHVADWHIEPASEHLPGDRRFVHLDVAHGAGGRLEGRLRMLRDAGEAAGDGGPSPTPADPLPGGFVVRDVFTDLRHHDLGPRFWEYSSHGGEFFATKRFRTPPLWGVGSTAPYGHDGRSPTLDAVIRRHGGAAEAAARAYADATPEDRQAVVAFLRSLVLYRPELLATDLDGDGCIVEDFQRDGLSLGPEVFRPELLFRTVPRYRGWVASSEDRFFSYSLRNRRELYGETLEALRDLDRDQIPDRLQAHPADGSPSSRSRPRRALPARAKERTP